MNYKKIYDNIINRRRNKTPEGYTEKHHIVPKSIGGSDAEDNVVRLTAREHFVCHYLLTKMYNKNTTEWHKMNLAFLCMKSSSLVQQRYFNSRLYSALKKEFSSTMKTLQGGEKNSQFGTRWIHSRSLKRSVKISKLEPLPEGWEEGRIMKFEKDIPCCKECGKEYILQKSEQFCSADCKSRKFRRIGPTTKWTAILSSLEPEYKLVKGSVSENRIFILEAMSKKVPKNQILWHLKCNNSGANYRTMKQIIAPTSGL